MVDRMCRRPGLHGERPAAQQAAAQERRPQPLRDRQTVGLPTLPTSCAELAKPGRDPRQQFAAFAFAEGVARWKTCASA